MMASAVLSSFCFASLFSAGGGTKSPALASRDESLVNWSGKAHDNLPILTEQLGESPAVTTRAEHVEMQISGGASGKRNITCSRGESFLIKLTRFAC
jgi:hypothetical protein